MRRWALLIGTLGVALLALGAVLLGVEVSIFRWTTQDHDFTGLTCGTPLDHPDWRRGQPCHGAVNRQTAVAGLTLFMGLGGCVAAIALLVQHQRTRRSNA